MIEWTWLVVERQGTLIVCPSADTHKTVAYTCTVDKSKE